MGQRNIRIVGRRRKEPDYRKLSRALLELAAAQAETDAEAAHKRKRPAADQKHKLTSGSQPDAD